ncbi:MAG: hypothetical protein QW303_06905 [Nitrososphaerota archaeon]
MVKILVINEVNDINQLYITHFSVDKGHYLAKSLSKIGHDVYFLTSQKDYERDGIRYVSPNTVNESFLHDIDLVIFSREIPFLTVVEKIPVIKNHISTKISNRKKPKIVIKSDFPLWCYNKNIRRKIHELFGVKMVVRHVREWVIGHIDYICAQNNGFKEMALKNEIPICSLLVSDMGIPNVKIDYEKLDNPYDINHSYCVTRAALLKSGKALLPLHYVEHPNEMNDFNKKKHIIVYTGRIKVDGGKILFNMRNIMQKLGDKYELHIFPGTFFMPYENKVLKLSPKSAHNLELLRDVIFRDSKNVIIHYSYEHGDRHRYLYHADCGIDFSDVRPRNIMGLAGHAKILEYCEVGLPVVCEENIGNLDIVRRGRNGIILPYMASDDQYVDAIQKMCKTKIDREYCRKITLQNENWDKIAQDLLNQIGIN